MGYLQVYIKKGYKLSLKDNNLYIKKYEDKNDYNTIPIEDISGILIEDPNSLITVRLLSKLSDSGIYVIICNEAYIPNTLIMPYNVNYNMLGVYHKQISFLQLDKDKLWQRIIRKKIENQREVIALTTNNQDIYSKMYELQKSVKLADKENREAYASKIYFQELFGEDFIRFSNEGVSIALNYGYTILNSTIIRYLTLYGFTTYIGIWHDSEKNNFNLASDLIESFRPIIDYYCYYNQNEIDLPLSTSVKKDLISLLTKSIRIDNKVCSIEYAIETMVKSLLKVMESKKIDDFLMPDIITIDFNKNE